MADKLPEIIGVHLLYDALRQAANQSLAQRKENAFGSTDDCMRPPIDALIDQVVARSRDSSGMYKQREGERFLMFRERFGQRTLHSPECIHLYKYVPNHEKTYAEWPKGNVPVLTIRITDKQTGEVVVFSDTGKNPDGTRFSDTQHFCSSHEGYALVADALVTLFERKELPTAAHMRLHNLLAR